MSTIAIIGAAGHIGDAAAREFLKAGWTVRGIGRNASAASLAPGIEPVRADAFDAEALARAVAGADVILHAANPPYHKWEGTVLAMMENTLKAARATGATVLLPGNVYNFGRSVHPGTNENEPERPNTDKGRIRVEMEGLCRLYAERDNVQTLVLRAGDFYGGGRPGTWLDLALLKDAKKGKLTVAGPDGVAHEFAYLPDLARAFVMLAEKRASLPPFDRFHFAGHALTAEDIRAASEKALGRSLNVARLNWTFVRLIGLAVPLMRELAKMSYLWFTRHSLDGSKFERVIGPLPHTPTDVAFAEAIAALDLDPAKTKRAA